MNTIQENSCLLDQDCTIEHEGQKFTSDGGFIGKDEKGKYGGILYGDWNYKTITNWDGSVKIPARYYGEHRGNMGDRRIFVRFRYEGRNFFGRWFGVDWSQIVRVGECK